jgi:integrase
MIEDGPDHKERERREKSSCLAYRDETGRVADFHALRHTFATNFARGGAHPKRAEDLAHHSDINLTMSRYSHTLMPDRAAAVEALPDLTARPDRERKQATKTDAKSLASR